MLIALATPNNLTIPAEKPMEKPETEAGTEPSRGISLLFSITAWCLAQTNQISSRNAAQNSCTKDTMLQAATLGSLKTETDSQYQLLKTNLLHMATPTTQFKTQVNNNCETHKEERDKPEHASQTAT
ncbi:hypothetical protein G9A89_008968 [Geosiphon pyriformis]|nr:hypothetical protein G9A89_008968 [Geosiphon pyriformis]